MGGKLTETIKDDIKIEGKKKVEVKSGDELRFKGATIKVAGIAAPPTGTGAFCGLPFCLATGAPPGGRYYKQRYLGGTTWEWTNYDFSY